MLKSFGDSPNYLGPDEFGKRRREEYEMHKEFARICKKSRMAG